jgi:acyl-CoA hydrolase
MQFIHPVKIGQLVKLQASVNRVFRTSMEVGVRVLMEDLVNGTVKHVSSAYLTFVAIDANGKGVEVTPVIPETDEQIRRFEQARVRREYRLSQRRPRA